VSAHFTCGPFHAVLTLSFLLCVYEQDSYAYTTATQKDPKSWGLDRVDDYYGLDKSYNYAYTGYGVHVYVLDVPIKNQADFGGRLASCVSFTTESCTKVSATSSHGTHVAGKLSVKLCPCFCMFERLSSH
jgi:subtilisin family serine protease